MSVAELNARGMDEARLFARVTLLQTRYIRALDARDLRAWADCFAPEASYICAARENEEQGLPLALMMDDTRARIEDRITFIEKIWAGTFEDYTMRHFVQPIASVQQADGSLRAESNFLVAYTSARGHSEILVAGCYQDTIESIDGEDRFRSKKAVLDTITTPRYLVYPV